MIALVDYGMGNLRSVEKALQKAGAEVTVVQDGAALARADRMVLPGVGAFGDCMRNLAKQQLIEPIKNFIQEGKPFLGICLGYQALFETSEENGGQEGLGIFRGKVIRFPKSNLKIPQIGWNQIQFKTPDCPLLCGVENGSYVYFVHSYFPQPNEERIVCTNTDYGLSFASMIWQKNVFASQFHPEKSQKVGLKILENFVRV